MGGHKPHTYIQWGRRNLRQLSGFVPTETKPDCKGRQRMTTLRSRILIAASIAISLVCASYGEARSQNIECVAMWQVHCDHEGCQPRKSIEDHRAVWSFKTEKVSRCASWEGQRFCMGYKYDRRYRDKDGSSFTLSALEYPNRIIGIVVQPMQNGRWSFLQVYGANDYKPTGWFEGGTCDVL